MEPLTINVTEADIATGTRQSATACPIALAAMRVLDLEPGWAFAFLDWLSIHDPARTTPHTYRLPDEANNFIIAFDEGALVAPFTFTASIPEE